MPKRNGKVKCNKCGRYVSNPIYLQSKAYHSRCLKPEDEGEVVLEAGQPTQLGNKPFSYP